MRTLVSIAAAAALVWASSACSGGNFAGASANKKSDAKADGKDGSKGGTAGTSGTSGTDGAKDDAKDDGSKDDGSKDGGEKDGAKDDSDGKDSLDAEPGTDDGEADDPLANIDSACKDLTGGGGGILGGILGGGDNVGITPQNAKPPKAAPSDCRVGFEFNNFKNRQFDITSAAGSRSLTLEVDIASYTAADRMRLLADGKLKLDTCRLRTASYADPTGGDKRPPEDSIRYFRVKIPKGTKKLTFDWGAAGTPTYIRVIGLCDFDTSAASAARARPVSD